MLGTVAIVVATCLISYYYFCHDFNHNSLRNGHRTITNYLIVLKQWFTRKSAQTPGQITHSRYSSRSVANQNYGSTEKASRSPQGSQTFHQRITTPPMSPLQAWSIRSRQSRSNSHLRSPNSSGPSMGHSPRSALARAFTNISLSSPDSYRSVIRQTQQSPPIMPRGLPNSPDSSTPMDRPWQPKFTLNRESTRLTGSPCTQRVTPSSPSSSLQPPLLHGPIKVTPTIDREQLGKRTRDVDTAEVNPRKEKVQKTMDERIPIEQLKRPPLREEVNSALLPDGTLPQGRPLPVEINVRFHRPSLGDDRQHKRPPLLDGTQIINMIHTRPLKGLNRIEASLSSSKRARERISSPDGMSPRNRKTRRVRLEDDSLDSSLIVKVTGLSKQSPAEKATQTPEKKPVKKRIDMEDEPGPNGNLKRPVNQVVKEKDSPSTTPKRSRKVDLKKSPSVSPEVPEWMKDKESDEYKDLVKRHMWNRKRNEQLAKERLKEMLRVIDGDEEKETTSTPVLTQTTTATAVSTLTALTVTTSVLTTTPTAGVQESLLPTTTVKTSPVTTASADSSKSSSTPSRLTPLAESPPGPKAATKTTQPQSGLLSALKEARSLAAPTSSSPKMALNFSIPGKASPVLQKSDTNVTARVVPSGSMLPKPEISLGVTLANPQVSSASSVAGTGFTVSSQAPVFSATNSAPKIQPAMSSAPAGAQQMPSPFTFSTQATAPNPTLTNVAQEPSAFSLSVPKGADSKDTTNLNFRPAFGPSPTKSQVPISSPAALQSSGFSFGVQSPAMPAQSTSSSFNVAAATPTQSQVPVSSTVASQSTGFTFGIQSPVAQPIATAPSSAASDKNLNTLASVVTPPFSFTPPPSSTTTLSNPVSTTNVFNIAPTTSSTTSKNFTFNAGPTSKSAATTSGFSFSAQAPAANTTQTTGPASKNLTTQAAGGFNFNPPTQSQSGNAGFTIPTTEPPKYGQTTSVASNSVFSQAATQSQIFGQTNPAKSTSSIFGQSSSTFGQTGTPSIFGAASSNQTSSSAPTGTTPANKSSNFTFGAQKQEGPSASTTCSAGFGSTSQSAKTEGFSFTAAAASATTKSSNPFMKGNTGASGFNFGTASSTPPVTTSSGFSFTAQASSAAPTSAPTSGMFAANTKPSSGTGFNFGATTQTPSFGQGGQTAPVPAFGQGVTPAFGQASNSTTTGFGTVSSPPAFGQATPVTPSFGQGATSTPSFGQTMPAAPVFGQSQATPAFGQTTASVPGFGKPTFGGAPSTPSFNVGTGSAAPKPRSTIKARRRVQRK